MVKHLIFHAYLDKIISHLYSKFIIRQRLAIKQRKVIEALLSMGLTEWKSFLQLLTGVILSFTDPITDILTLVEYYHAEHFK